MSEEYKRSCSHGETLHWKDCPECRERMVRSGFKEEIAEALESQMSDLIDSMPTKMNCPCGKFNCHGKGYDDALDEVLLLMKKV